MAVGLLLAGFSTAGASYAPLPSIEYGRQLLGNLSLPSVGPGGSTSLTFTVADPVAWGESLTGVEVTFQVYAFNGFPQNASALLDLANPPVLSTATASGSTVTEPLADLAPGGVDRGAIGVATSASTPTGTYAVRTAVQFTAGAQAYLLESRGWFTAAQWTAATEYPNGTPTLNVTMLGVSGVTPETALLVADSNWPWVLGGVLAAGLLLVGAGAYLYFRRTGGSSSGTG